MNILHALGSLFVGAVPTMILFILLVIAYNVLVRRPLEQTLAARRARTSGAVEQARGAIAAAEAETAVYEDKLRAARSEIAAERERHLKQRQTAREQALGTARDQAQTRIHAARIEIADSVDIARLQLDAVVDDLGERIVRAILPAGAAQRAAQQEVPQ